MATIEVTFLLCSGIIIIKAYVDIENIFYNGLDTAVHKVYYTKSNSFGRDRWRSVDNIAVLWYCYIFKRRSFGQKSIIYGLVSSFAV